jgi:hypothetical protein
LKFGVPHLRGKGRNPFVGTNQKMWNKAQKVCSLPAELVYSDLDRDDKIRTLFSQIDEHHHAS